jgi:hypothetical protein
MAEIRDIKTMRDCNRKFNDKLTEQSCMYKVSNLGSFKTFYEALTNYCQAAKATNNGVELVKIDDNYVVRMKEGK